MNRSVVRFVRSTIHTDSTVLSSQHCPMAKASLVFSVLAVLCIVAAAAPKPTFLGDNLASTVGLAKASIANYYDDTEVACLSQLNYKNCRYTGCPIERQVQTSSFDASGNVFCSSVNNVDACEQCWPDSLYFQTDFSCCAKEHGYGGHREDVGSVGFNNKVSICDWEISMYRTPYSALNSGGTAIGGGGIDPWTPHLTDDGTALKFGTVWGTCYLNAEAEHCDHPLCERMAINIQGGLYGACAYSPDKTVTFADRGELCNNELPSWLDAINGIDDTPPNSGASEFEKYLNYIKAYTCTVLGPKCGTGCSTAAISSVTEAKLAYDTDHDSPEKYYPGIALMISGPMHITSKKDKAFEETGLFEMALNSDTANPVEAVTEPVNRWPIVRGKGAKLRFTREEEGRYERSQ